MVADLKTPFNLQGAQRVDETPAHEALREAFVNSLIHTDYRAAGGVVITRRDDRFQIENPGTLLVSREQLRRGGVSECRNKSLQRMFMLLGSGEQAGSGFARIQHGWKSQSWRAPRLIEQSLPDRVRLEMPMVSLLPEWAFLELRARIGSRFTECSEIERIAVATSLIEGEVTNARMQDFVADHPADISKGLRSLVRAGHLLSDNSGRWSRYRLPDGLGSRLDLLSPLRADAAHDLSGSQQTEMSSLHTGGSSQHSEEGSSHTGDSSPHNEDSNPRPITDIEPLRQMAAPVAAQKRASATKLKAVILELCRGRYLKAEHLAALCQRDLASLRDRTLSKMVRSGELRLRFPDRANHPEQAYTSDRRP